MSVLSAQNISYFYRTKYQTVQAVNEVSCDLEAGLLYALVGKSGSGKNNITFSSGRVRAAAERAYSCTRQGPE